jgi:hypothetical protein
MGNGKGNRNRNGNELLNVFFYHLCLKSYMYPVSTWTSVSSLKWQHIYVYIDINIYIYRCIYTDIYIYICTYLLFQDIYMYIYSFVRTENRIQKFVSLVGKRS